MDVSFDALLSFLPFTNTKQKGTSFKERDGSVEGVAQKIVTLTMKEILAQSELLSYLAVTVILLGFGFCPNLRDMKRVLLRRHRDFSFLKDCLQQSRQQIEPQP
ncbi:hypothetical protein CEXT_146911 [Caerostris extrusa]|uniref:Uncharacterized protein n=1 Tax=Caerostris extrusa TaxID=172846 RepID=A0AAV4XXD8_CAEEX|nr:hypothetical protein CEXT_146911 [Caerostris extrusa]